jgi:hypothetical protein
MEYAWEAVNQALTFSLGSATEAVQLKLQTLQTMHVCLLAQAEQLWFQVFAPRTEIKMILHTYNFIYSSINSINWNIY